MEKHALVDVGSNTIRMNVYDIDRQNGIFNLLFSEKETLGILNFISGGLLVQDGIDKLLAVLKNFKKCAGSVACGYFTCFATASLRGILNKDDVIAEINNALDINIDLISGEDEALYSFYAVKKYFNLDRGKGLLIDMGGGSTEFLSFENGAAVKSASEPFASLSLHKKFVSKIMPSKEEAADIIKYADKKLEKTAWLNDSFDSVFFIGGTGRAAAKIHRAHYKRDILSPVNGYKINSADISGILDYYFADKQDLTSLLIKEAPDRIHTFIPGLILYSRIMRVVKCAQVTVSSFGIREGYLMKNILKEI